MLLAVLLGLAGAARAQDTSVFHIEDLEGYVECTFSACDALHDYSSFEELEGRRLSSTQLEEVRRRWKAEQGRAHAALAESPADPLGELRRHLAHDPFFKTVSFDEEHREPFVFLIQKPEKTTPNYQRRIVEFYGPWLEVVLEEWHREFIEPLAVERRADYSRYVLIVLRTRGDYLNLAQARRAEGLYAARAFYLPELRAAVTYEDPFGSGNVEKEQLRAALHEMVHALQHSYSASDTLAGPGLNEGLAEYLSNPAHHKTSVRELQHLSGEALQELAFVLRVPELRSSLLLSPAELLAEPTYRSFLEHVRSRSTATTPTSGLAMSVLYAHAGLLAYYANEGDAGRYRGNFQDYLARVLRNEPDAWAAAFPEKKGEELARDFEAFLDRELQQRGYEVVSLPEGAPAASAPAPPQPELLRVTEPDAELRLALALERAARGELGPAIQDLAGAAEGSQRAARETPRLQALAALRGEFLETWPRSRNLVLDEQLFGKIVEVRPDALVLQSTQRGTFEVPVAALTPRLVAETILEKKLELGAPADLACALALGGDAAWSRVFSGAAPPRELREDLEDLPRLLRMARAAQRLGRLAEAGVPGDEPAAHATLDAVRAVHADRELALVAERAGELGKLARAAFAVLAEGRTEEFLATRVKPEVAADGTWELRYAFDSAEELEDFQAVDQANPAIQDEDRPLLRDDAPPPRVAGGTLMVRGDLALRHVLEFEAPLEVELVSSTLEYPDPAVQAMLFVVFCDDGYGSFALGSQEGNLYVLDKATGHQDSYQQRRELFFDVRYHVHIVHDGTTISSTLDGQPAGAIPAGARTRGAFLLWPHTDADQAIHELVIRGKLDPTFLQRRKDAWIDEQMREFAP